jgi:hypothetical protein
MMIFSSLASSFAVFVTACSVVLAQPSPDVQRRISAAIEAAIISGSRITDYTAFVNPFIGTGTFLHQPSDHLGPISNIRYSYQIIMEMYGSCQVCNELYMLLTHPLSDTAQAHLSRLAWYVVFCDVPNDGI